MPAAWIRDRQSGRAWLVAEPGFDHLLERFAEDVRDCARLPDRRMTGFQVEEEDPQRFLESVRRALDYIAAGRRVPGESVQSAGAGDPPSPIDPAALYRALRAANPSPFAAMLRDGDFAVISSSPERLVSAHGGIVSTRPIAGTRPRGASPERDAALIESLLDNEKERAEHVMLIDLERNDLGRVCLGGSVRVDEYMTVESYAHVHHIVSNVSGLKLDAVSPVQILRAMFPGGTITGCPKVRCMEIIARARGRGTRRLHRLDRLHQPRRQLRFQHPHPHDHRTRTCLRLSSGRRHRRRFDPAHELAETRAKAEGLLRALRATR